MLEQLKSTRHLQRSWRIPLVLFFQLELGTHLVGFLSYGGELKFVEIVYVVLKTFNIVLVIPCTLKILLVNPVYTLNIYFCAYL